MLLDLGEEPLWDRLAEESRRQAQALLEQMLAEIWMDRSRKETTHEREDHLSAS
jgi:hypothetical protein